MPHGAADAELRVYSHNSLETPMKLTLAKSRGVFAPNPLVLACSMAIVVASGSARADQAADMQAKLDALQKQVLELQSQMNAMAPKVQKHEEAAVASTAPNIRIKPGDALTFQIGDKNEVTIYGHVDVSADYQSNGLKNAVGATGNNGWVGDISSNLSSFGVRGSRQLSDDLKANGTYFGFQS